MKLDTVSTTRETIPLPFCEFLRFRIAEADLLELPDRARAPEVPFALPDVALDLDELLFDFDDVARPFLIELLFDEEIPDFAPEPFPDLGDLAFADEDFALDKELDRADLPTEEDDFERDPAEPLERPLLVDFPRADELLDEDDSLFDLLKLPDFAVPFFAELDFEDLDLDAPLIERDEADSDEPLLEREEADFAVRFPEVDSFFDLDPFEPVLELDDFFAVAIFASIWK